MNAFLGKNSVTKDAGSRPPGSVDTSFSKGVWVVKKTQTWGHSTQTDQETWTVCGMVDQKSKKPNFTWDSSLEELTIWQIT